VHVYDREWMCGSVGVGECVLERERQRGERGVLESMCARVCEHVITFVCRLFVCVVNVLVCVVVSVCVSY
jgi:hypothetical protein